MNRGGLDAITPAGEGHRGSAAARPRRRACCRHYHRSRAQRCKLPSPVPSWPWCHDDDCGRARRVRASVHRCPRGAPPGGGHRPGMRPGRWRGNRPARPRRPGFDRSGGCDAAAYPISGGCPKGGGRPARKRNCSECPCERPGTLGAAVTSSKSACQSEVTSMLGQDAGYERQVRPALPASQQQQGRRDDERSNARVRAGTSQRGS